MPSQDLIIPYLPRPGSNEGVNLSKPGIHKVGSAKASETEEHNVIQADEEHLTQQAVQQKPDSGRERRRGDRRRGDRRQDKDQADERRRTADPDDPHFVDTFV